jgi:hypothetical protein
MVPVKVAPVGISTTFAMVAQLMTVDLQDDRLPLQAALLLEDAEAAAPATPWATPVLASSPKFANWGMATALRMPMMTMTMTSSISVKPDCEVLLRNAFIMFS